MLCGAFVTFATVINLGCASPAQTRMSVQELDTFVVNCYKKEEQINFISSQYISSPERVDSAIINTISPWLMFTSPSTYMLNENAASKRHEWMIKQILIELSACD